MPGGLRIKFHIGACRDLDVITDFRDVLAELVTRHMGQRDIATVFPGYEPKFRNLM